MKIEQLQQLLAVVEEGSMNEAAQKLYVARSSLSTSMKNLEAELGALIFERTTRGVMLTAFGRDVHPSGAGYLPAFCLFAERTQNQQGGTSVGVQYVLLFGK